MKRFECKKLKTNIPNLFHYVWVADSGDLIIVVIDDNWDAVITNTPKAVNPTTAALPTLNNQAQQWPETRAIGFFMMPPCDIDQVLKDIQNWLCKIQTSDNRICFLVDAIYESDERETFEPANCFVDKLSSLYSPHQIAYLTQAGSGVEGLWKKHEIFSKTDEINEVRGDRKQFSPKFMQFFGKKWHKDEIISDAIQLYAKAWNKRWDPEGWDHNELQNRCSDHSKALADWLEIDVNDLCNYEGQSAKALMIWLENLFSTDVRQIQGKVLNAVLKKLDLPLSTKYPIPNDEFIYMPCIPCFPLLVSLRSFLLRCAEEGASVSEIQFIQNNGKCIFRLMMNLDDHEEFEKRFRETICKHGKKPLDEHTFTRSLRYLVYCMTEGLPNDMGRDYIRLFTKGTEEPVVKVTIEKDYIDLIWCC